MSRGVSNAEVREKTQNTELGDRLPGSHPVFVRTENGVRQELVALVKRRRLHINGGYAMVGLTAFAELAAAKFAPSTWDTLALLVRGMDYSNRCEFHGGGLAASRSRARGRPGTAARASIYRGLSQLLKADLVRWAGTSEPVGLPLLMLNPRLIWRGRVVTRDMCLVLWQAIKGLPQGEPLTGRAAAIAAAIGNGAHSADADDDVVDGRTEKAVLALVRETLGDEALRAVLTATSAKPAPEPDPASPQICIRRIPPECVVVPPGELLPTNRDIQEELRLLAEHERNVA